MFNKKRKRVKRCTDWKCWDKMIFICGGHDYLCWKCQRILKKKTCCPNSEFSKVTGYKVNLHIVIAYLCRSSEQLEFNILKCCLLWNASVVESHKQWCKIKENLTKMKNVSYTWTGRLIIDKMPILPRLIYRKNRIPIKTAASFL